MVIQRDETASREGTCRQYHGWSTRKFNVHDRHLGSLEAGRLVTHARLTSAFAHDLRTFCHQASGCVLLLKTALEDGQSLRVTKLANALINAVQSISTLAEQVMSSGSEHNVMQKESLFKIVSSLESLVRPTIDSTVSFEVQFLCKTEIFVVANVLQLQQILINLINNAVHALTTASVSPVSSRKITLIIHPMERVEDRDSLSVQTNSYVGISVVDNGVGMSDDVLSHISEPFFTTKPEMGTGLGLFMSAYLSNMHGGSLTVRTKHTQGSIFTVCLPRVC